VVSSLTGEDTLARAVVGVDQNRAVFGVADAARCVPDVRLVTVGPRPQVVGLDRAVVEERRVQVADRHDQEVFGHVGVLLGQGVTEEGLGQIGRHGVVLVTVTGVDLVVWQLDGSVPAGVVGTVATPGLDKRVAVYVQDAAVDFEGAQALIKELRLPVSSRPNLGIDGQVILPPRQPQAILLGQHRQSGVQGLNRWQGFKGSVDVKAGCGIDGCAACAKQEKGEVGHRGVPRGLGVRPWEEHTPCQDGKSTTWTVLHEGTRSLERRTRSVDAVCCFLRAGRSDDASHAGVYSQGL
jgi:hypothetical protein